MLALEFAEYSYRTRAQICLHHDSGGMGAWAVHGVRNGIRVRRGAELIDRHVYTAGCRTAVIRRRATSIYVLGRWDPRRPPAAATARILDGPRKSNQAFI